MKLILPVTSEEVKKAVFSMYPEKAPGYDGLNPCFYQAYWSIVGEDVVEFYRRFLDKGELPEGVNRTVVCLIPKITQPQAMTDRLKAHLTLYCSFSYTIESNGQQIERVSTEFNFGKSECIC